MKKATSSGRTTKKRAAAKAPQKRRPGASEAGTPESPGGDWRAQVLARVRELILKADPAAVEEVKWRKPSNGMKGVPVWSHDGLICTGETYTSAVKLTFAKGAALDDPAGLFNSSLEGNTRRAIDIRQSDTLNGKAFMALIRAAVKLNTGAAGPRSTARARKPSRGR